MRDVAHLKCEFYLYINFTEVVKVGPSKLVYCKKKLIC